MAVEPRGYLHDKVDVKVLILFILARIDTPLSTQEIFEVAYQDDSLNYFVLAESLPELVETGHIDESETGYTITEKGARNADEVESSLPFSVRSKALRLLEPIVERMRRAAMIGASHTVGDDGCFVKLSMSDGAGDIIQLRLLCADERQAEKIEKNFRKGAEGYYHKIIELLS